MKIYTKTGDSGTTGLLGGPRVLKSDARIAAYGTVDELNAMIGLARSFMSGSTGGSNAGREPADVDQMLSEIQIELNVLQFIWQLSFCPRSVPLCTLIHLLSCFLQTLFLWIISPHSRGSIRLRD